MCRLYGFSSTRPTKVECGLVRAQNALMAQSRRDSRGLTHHDGWGIAYYQNADPTVVRRSAAAYQDLRFSKAARQVYARIVIAHVRKATVGGRSETNLHPFRVGRWCFAHNGTIPLFEKIRPLIEAETAPEWLAHRRGSTDSELLFLWILSGIHQTRGAEEISGDHRPVVNVVRRAILKVKEWCLERAAPDAPGLSFLLTDGRDLFVSRSGNGLYWVYRDRIHPCEICRACHCSDCAHEPLAQHGPEVAYRAVAVASEPLTQEDWQEIPEGHLLLVDDRLHPAQPTCMRYAS